jgi:hypothetical protein
MGVCHPPGRMQQPVKHHPPWSASGGRAVSQALTCETPPAFADMGHRDRDDHRARYGAGPAIARFSVAHHITGSPAWVTALVMSKGVIPEGVMSEGVLSEGVLSERVLSEG